MCKSTVYENSVEDWTDLDDLNERVVHALKSSDDVSNEYNEKVVALIEKGLHTKINLEDFDIESEPEWLDKEKIVVGQKFGREFMLANIVMQLASLVTLYSHDDILRKLYWTGRFNNNYTSMKRYLSTFFYIYTWYTDDLFDRNTAGFKNLRKVNLFHKSFYNKLGKSDRKTFLDVTSIDEDNSSVCPVIRKVGDATWLGIDAGQLPIAKYPLTQLEMMYTQVMFFALMIIRPEKFGIDSVARRDELECFIHLWRYLGYKVGIEDEFNACSGSLQQVVLTCTAFIRLIITTYLRQVNGLWENMTRSMIEGGLAPISGVHHVAFLMFTMELQGIDYNHLYAKSSLADKIQHWCLKVYFRYFNSIGWIRRFVTELFWRRMNELYRVNSEQEHQTKTFYWF